MRLKPLQFVSPKDKPERVGLITEISTYKAVGGKVIEQCSIAWIGGEKGLYSSWWLGSHLDIIDSLPRVLSARLAHPFGDGKKFVDESYPLEE